MCTGAHDTCLVHATPTTTNVLTYTRLWPSIVMSFDSIFQKSTILNWIYRILRVVLRGKGCCFWILFTSKFRVLPRLVCPWSYSMLQLRILIVGDNFGCDVTHGSTFWWACCLVLIWRVLPIKRVVSKCTLSLCACIMSWIRYVFLSVCLSVRVCLSIMVCLSKSIRSWANALHYRALDLHHVIHQICLSRGLFFCLSLSICLCVQVYPSLSVRLRRRSIPLCGGSGPVGTFRKVLMTCIYMHKYICICIVLSVLAGTQGSMLSLRRRWYPLLSYGVFQNCLSHNVALFDCQWSEGVEITNQISGRRGTFCTFFVVLTTKLAPPVLLTNDSHVSTRTVTRKKNRIPLFQTRPPGDCRAYNRLFYDIFQNPSLSLLLFLCGCYATTQLQSVFFFVIECESGDGGSAKQEKNRFFGTQHQKIPARARWIKRLGLIRETPRADFVVIGV